MNKEILNMPSNKVKITIEMTAEQRKDFLRALNDIKRLGAKDDGRAVQLLAIDYFSGHYEKLSTDRT